MVQEVAQGLIAERHYSLVEAARWLAVSKHTLRAWCRQRRIAHVRAGRRLVFFADDLRAFAARHRVEAREGGE